MASLILIGIGLLSEQPVKAPAFCEHITISNWQVYCHGQGKSAGALALLDGKKINLNQASEIDLLHIPRLSKKVAQAILKKRKELGRFTHPDQLDAIKGVGPKTKERLLQMTTLDFED